MKYFKIILQVVLGLFMLYAGISHLSFNRTEFVAQVPMWLRFSPSFTDFVVIASGVAEIALGVGMLCLWNKYRGYVGSSKRFSCWSLRRNELR